MLFTGPNFLLTRSFRLLFCFQNNVRLDCVVMTEATGTWPIVYRKEYNIRFFGIENFHPFDSKKWGNIYKVSTEKRPKLKYPTLILYV